MRRTVAVAALLALASMVGVVVYHAASREGEYRRLIGEGDAANAADQTFVAIEAFSGAIALKPDSMLAHLRRGESYRKRGELSAAVRDLRRACELDPAAPQPVEQLGDVYYERGGYAAAVAQYQRYLALDDRSPRVLYKLALARRSAGQMDEAIAALRRSLELDDRFAEAHYLLGVCLRETKQPRAAIGVLERAIALAPALVPAREELAGLYRAFDRIDDEIEQLAALGGIESSRAERQIALGLAYARARRLDTAVQTLGAAVDRFPQQPRVYAALGRVWLDAAEARGDRAALRKALEALTTIATTPSADSASLALFGRALVVAGDLEGAEQVLRQASERFPVDPGAFTLLASVASRSGHPAVARDALVKYASLTGSATEARVLVQIGDLSLQTRDPEGAIAWYERALTAGPPDVQVESRLAQAQIRAGDLPAARTTVGRALARDPANPAILALARRLKM